MAIQTSVFLEQGLRAVGCHERLLSRSVPMRKKLSRFKACFGQLPAVMARVWIQLAKVEDERNLERFFMLLFWFKTYPTEAVLAVRFGIEEETVRLWLWFYTEAMSILKEDLIQWPENFPDAIKFPTVVDGTHCCMFEPMHDLWPMDPNFFGHKHNTASANYQICLSTYESTLYAVDGPYPAGSHSDATIFAVSGVQQRMVDAGQRAIADGGYDGTPGIIAPNRKYHTKQNKASSIEPWLLLAMSART